MFTLIMLLLRGISDLASNPTEVLAVSTPAWLPGATRDPVPTMFSEIPQSPFKTDTSQCVLPAASSLGTAVSPRFNGGRLPSSPNSAIGTSSTHTDTHTQAGKLLGSKALCFSFTPISCLAYCLVTFARNSAISSPGAHICQAPTDRGACSVHCALQRETTAISIIRQHDISSSSPIVPAIWREHEARPGLTQSHFLLHWKRMLTLHRGKAVLVNAAW